MKTYVFADLHGRFDLLMLAYEAIQRDADGEKAVIVCLGDFVDRGPQSREIIDFLMRKQLHDQQFTWVVLQGNHEDIMLQAIANPQALRWWKGNGGGATLKSYGASTGNNPHYTTARVPQDHIRWLAALPITHQDEYRIYVHAGVPMDKPVGMVPVETKQWMLYREDQDELYPDADYHDGSDLHVSGKHVVHGHHQSENHPLLREGRTNLDTFAWATGRLAVGVFDEAVPGGPVNILEVKAEPDPRVYFVED